MMERIILFRFHKNPLICANRIALLRHFNPGTRIFGLYGGDELAFSAFQKKIGADLNYIYCIRGKTAEWKWKNGDLAVRRWFLDHGKDIPFDMLHIIEWDMIMCDSLENIFRKVPKGGMGLAGLTKLSNVGKSWIWASQGVYKDELERLISYAKDNYGYAEEPYRCLAGGACIPREFMVRYSGTDIPELCNDEVRLPLFAQLFKVGLYDTGFYQMNDEERKYFNLFRPVELKLIRQEIGKPGGRRIFHPYYKVFDPAGDFWNFYNVRYDVWNWLRGLIKKAIGERTYGSVRDRLRRDFKPRKKP